MAPNCKRPFERAPGSIISAGHKIVGGDTIGDGRNLRLGARFFDASQRERVGLEGARPSQSREQVRAVRKEHTFVSHVAGTSRQPERPLDERLRFRVSAQEQQYRNFLVQCERKMPLQSQDPSNPQPQGARSRARLHSFHARFRGRRDKAAAALELRSRQVPVRVRPAPKRHHRPDTRGVGSRAEGRK